MKERRRRADPAGTDDRLGARSACVLPVRGDDLLRRLEPVREVGLDRRATGVVDRNAPAGEVELRNAVDAAARANLGMLDRGAVTTRRTRDPSDFDLAAAGRAHLADLLDDRDHAVDVEPVGLRAPAPE